jgi:hypothetical protein
LLISWVLQQMKVGMKSIWTGEPNEKQRGQRDFVLRQREQRHTEARVLRAFFDLLRVGDLSNSMKTTQLTSGIGARTRSRCAVDVIGGGSAGQQASCYYEVVGNRARKAISHRCRLGLDYIYPPAAPASSPSSASAWAPNALNHACLPLRRCVWSQHAQSRLV